MCQLLAWGIGLYEWGKNLKYCRAGLRAGHCLAGTEARPTLIYLNCRDLTSGT